MAGDELPPRSAAAVLLARPPVLSLGLGLSSAGSLRPPAALMSVEAEPAAEGQRLGVQAQLRGWERGARGGREMGVPLVLVRSSAGLLPPFVSSRTSISQRGQLKPREMKGILNSWSEQRQIWTQVYLMPEAGQFHPVAFVEFQKLP